MPLIISDFTALLVSGKLFVPRCVLYKARCRPGILVVRRHCSLLGGQGSCKACLDRSGIAPCCPECQGYLYDTSVITDIYEL